MNELSATLVQLTDSEGKDEDGGSIFNILRPNRTAAVWDGLEEQGRLITEQE